MIGRRAIIQALVGVPLSTVASKIADAAPGLESSALAQVGDVPEMLAHTPSTDGWEIMDLANNLDSVRMTNNYDAVTPSVQSMRSWSPAFKAQIEAEKRIEFQRRRVARRRWVELARKAAGGLG